MIQRAKWSGVSGRVWSLVSGYPGEQRRKRQLLVFQVRIDDSASNDGRVFVLAGYIAPAEKWAEFADEWKALLDEEPPLTRFKMNEMARSGVKRRRCERFYRVIERHVTGAVSCVIKADELAEVVDNIKPPKGVKNWDGLKNPYFFAFGAIIQKLAIHQEKFKITEPIDFIFDMQTEQAQVREGWNYMYLSVTPDLRAMLGNPPTFLDDEKDLPLQAADMWAWFVRRWEVRGTPDGFKNLNFRSARFFWDAERDMPRMNIVFGKKDFQHEFDNMIAKSDEFLERARIPPEKVEAAVVTLRKGQSS